MSHTAEGALQAYLDGELDGAASAAVDQHVAACAVCARELAALRTINGTASTAFALLDTVQPPMLRAQAAIAAAKHAPAPRRWAILTASGLTKAAMLLLALTGAAAAIPGTPVRRALESTLARLFDNDSSAVVSPVAGPDSGTTKIPEMEELAISISPANGAVRIVLHAPVGAVDVTVRLTDGEQAEVETSSDIAGVKFRSASGRVEVVGMGTGTVIIAVPRAVDAARIEVNGTVHAFKQNGVLRLSGPAGTGQGSEVKFRIEP